MKFSDQKKKKAAERGDFLAGKVVPEWVRRLYEGADLHINDKRLSWNALHIEQFLAWCRRWCRRRGEGTFDLGTTIRAKGMPNSVSVTLLISSAT